MKLLQLYPKAPKLFASSTQLTVPKARSQRNLACNSPCHVSKHSWDNVRSRTKLETSFTHAHVVAYIRHERWSYRHHCCRVLGCSLRVHDRWGLRARWQRFKGYVDQLHSIASDIKGPFFIQIWKSDESHRVTSPWPFAATKSWIDSCTMLRSLEAVSFLTSTSHSCLANPRRARFNRWWALVLLPRLSERHWMALETQSLELRQLPQEQVSISALLLHKEAFLLEEAFPSLLLLHPPEQVSISALLHKEVSLLAEQLKTPFPASAHWRLRSKSTMRKLMTRNKRKWSAWIGCGISSSCFQVILKHLLCNKYPFKISQILLVQTLRVDLPYLELIVRDLARQKVPKRKQTTIFRRHVVERRRVIAQIYCL